MNRNTMDALQRARVVGRAGFFIACLTMGCLTGEISNQNTGGFGGTNQTGDDPGLPGGAVARRASRAAARAAAKGVLVRSEAIRAAAPAGGNRMRPHRIPVAPREAMR